MTRRYSAYRDSGVEWVGEIPVGWTTLPAYAVGFERNEPNTGMKDDNLLSLSYGRIVSKDIEGLDGLLPESFETYQIVHPGDIVLRLTDLQNDKRSLRSAIVNERGIITSAYVAFAPTNIDSRYLSYLLRDYDLRKVFYSMGGGLRQGMKYADIRRLPLIVPPLPEQTRIVAFLDRETAKIDALVEEQRQMIDLLKEKRQAVISHAVTRGLNPDAKLKPSGVEWLGDVPEGWTVATTGRFASILSGYAFPSTGFSLDESDTPLLRGVNVGVGSIRWEETVYWKRTEEDGLEPWVLKEGDLVIGMDRPWVSAGVRVAIVQAADLPCLLLQRVAAIRTTEKLDKRYLMLHLSSEFFLHFFLPDMTGVSVPHISPTQICNFPIAVPLIEEQRAIVEYVAKQTERFNSLMNAADKAIALLQERRAALISAAVTGKIDVRDPVSQETEAA